jgi:thymidylate kinase
MSFFVVEGPNGSGKTTLINNLKKDGYNILFSPGSTRISNILRPMCRGTEPYTDIDPRIQFMLFSASRYDEYLRLVHNKKEVIISDRWWTSTIVYQCVLQGFPVDFLEHTIHPQEQIDCVFLLDAADNILVDRVNKERLANPKHGVCTWTQNEETIKKISSIYRNELPEYLVKRNVRYVPIHTDKLNGDEVADIIKQMINTINSASAPEWFAPAGLDRAAST